jgi:hypothetical protein
MPEVTAEVMPEVAAIRDHRGAPEHSRFADAILRMGRRLGRVLEALGDDASTRFLAQLAEGVTDDLIGDGSCLALPTSEPQPVDRLVARVGPVPLEIDLLALAALPHHHEGIAAILRGLHPDGRAWPTAGLAASLADLGLLAGGGGRPAVRAALEGGALARARALVLDSDGPAPDRSLRMGPLLFDALEGLGGWPEGCRPDRRPAPVEGLGAWLRHPSVLAARAALERLAPVAVLAPTNRPEALAARLAALVRSAGHEPVVLQVPHFDGVDCPATLLLAVVRGVVPVLWSRSDPADALAGIDLPVPVLLSVPGDGLVAWPRPVLAVPTAPLGKADRLEAIGGLLPELGALAHPVGPATMEPGEVAVVAHDLRARARLGHLPITHVDVTAAVDARTATAVPDGAVLLHPCASWDDLVLPDDRRQQLREAVVRMEHQETVLEQWGFLAGRTGRRGLRLLFCGPPGTGKTLAAEVIARELGQDLLRVDLSQMVSKWIGETEKNLAAAFEAAEVGGAVLFFDEADALFGKRTEVGDSRDRYANLETAYLLSRLERFDGVAVLATNLRQNLDTAFARRIEFIVPFDLPDVAEREELWRRHLPPGAPLAASVDCARLAALYDLPGALIRNAAVAAAFLAAADGVRGPAAITLRHIVHAVRREYVKAGQAFPGAPTGLVPMSPSRGARTAPDPSP